ncbi:bifunctional Gfo/Idh/MocA family oxidoreductase/class I SAM-dependent methyltransferase [Paenibacillus sp. UMB4589-SE434]|uniref:bifunctional Gfo/Idh/MocA family oxidoreductase/class I SAM-dependent methyltransferase n=1 Tax=Paenibacillus sp. UMB4589-SE434 TaxID=3046314 RepID=UPI00254C44B3|nr:bifunctional Gfo/Idh/MocA family oxidoreductase/class I SAM-dependent methyltransferase [Paenibacillus sp. UMB4589-SE434]MDK8183096.1 bifunctional Gfo/Idh/MocA family oxidoreductase/class I SAM-dependent methyltransferase [Paenibacillus sp. UMB4589-SE434]
MSEPKPLRTIVCGSRFGQFYLEAVSALPEQFELVGLFAKGSERSRKCAERYGVPLYTELDQLPEHVDLACVVLRSGVMGGSGTEIALELLARGIHVIQEQPVHHKDMAACLRTARQHGVHFQTGDLYVHLPAIQRFIRSARVLLEQQQALYLDVACATQVSFPLMHILLEALPTIRPWQISHVIREQGPFQVLIGSLGNIPITLRAHNEVDPHDPDNYLHLLHRMAIGVEGGSLSLVDTHGPVVWHPRLHVPDLPHIAGELENTTSAHLLGFSTEILGGAISVSYRDILLKQWPRAIGQDLLAMRDVILGNVSKADIDTLAQQELLCARQWQELTTALGYPLMRASSSHQPLAVEQLIAAASAITPEPEETEHSIVQVVSTNSTARTDEVGMKALTEERVVSGQGPNQVIELDVFRCTDYAESTLGGINAVQVTTCVNRLDDAALSSMLFALQSQGAFISTNQEFSEEELLVAGKVARRHQHVIKRWLPILAEHGYITLNKGRIRSVGTVTSAMVHERWDAVKQAWNGKLGSPLVIDYLMRNAEMLPQLMSDTQQAALLLFPEGRMDVANALYRDTAIARYLNESVAEAVIRIAANKRVMSPTGNGTNGKLRILEIGAGTGATTDVVTKRLQEVLPGQLAVDYLFTDISKFFISTARERYDHCPWLRYNVVDIDRDLTEQGLTTHSVDVVIAAGMLNNARDTDKVVQGLMQVLVPGGWMLITEPTREFVEMLISQAFMMTVPEDDRQLTQTTFMSVHQWLEVFQLAGADEVAAFPDEAHPLAPLGQKLFVVRKGLDAEVQPHIV